MSVEVLLPTSTHNSHLNMNLAGFKSGRVGNACCKLEAGNVIRPSTPPILDPCSDCVSTRSKYIPAIELADKIMSNQPLILDIRPFIAYNTKHIMGAVNISCCDRFTKRRLQSGKVSITDLLSKTKKCAKEKWRNLMGEVIVYDDSTTDLGETNNSHPLRLVLQSLLREGKEAQVLQGGLREFQVHYSQLCEKQKEGDGHCPLYSPTTPAIEPAIDTAIASEILPNIYIGNERDAANRERLEELGITHILNVTGKLPNHFEGKGMTYCRLPATDSGFQNLRQYFHQGAVFIEEACKSGGKVLVHCQAGVSRSPTITLAYLMKRSRMNMADAYKFVKHQRSIISPNFNFLGQLMEFEKSLDSGEEVRQLDPPIKIETCL